MSIGTLFTLFVVPVFYSIIAAEHQPKPVLEEDAPETRPAGPLTPIGELVHA